MMKKMKPAEKAGFIWDYYRLPLLGAAAGIALAVYFLVLFLHPAPSPVLSVEVINSSVGIGNGTEFYDHFLAFEKMSETDGPIRITNNLFFDLSRESDYSSTYYMKLLAEIEAGTVDAVIAGRTNTEKMGSAGYFLDLRDGRTNALYKKYRDAVLTVKDADGKERPVAFDLSKSKVLFDAGIVYNDKACFAISEKATHTENVGKLLDYLFAGSQGENAK